MVQAISRRPRIAESRFRYKTSSCESFGGQTSTEADVSYLCLRVALSGQTGEDWKPSKNNVVSENGEHWI